MIKGMQVCLNKLSLARQIDLQAWPFRLNDVNRRNSDRLGLTLRIARFNMEPPMLTSQVVAAAIAATFRTFQALRKLFIHLKT